MQTSMTMNRHTTFYGHNQTAPAVTLPLCRKTENSRKGDRPNVITNRKIQKISRSELPSAPMKNNKNQKSAA
jgi:hypothetical protein